MSRSVDNRCVKAECQYNPREIDVQIRGFFLSDFSIPIPLSDGIAGILSFFGKPPFIDFGDQPE
jgi:hypothetical protein